MPSKLAQKLPLPKALFLIFISILLVSGSAWASWFIYFKFFDIRASDFRYQIVAIVQTGPEREALQTSYLAELLDLSVDQPKNIYHVNLKEEQEKLNAVPLIRQAVVKRIPPGTLYVDYSLRNPVAYLADVTNTVIDESGVLFPFKPFFSPKRLPEFYLGLNREVRWGDQIHGEDLRLAFEVYKSALESRYKNELEIIRIDVSRAFSESLGRKQVVLFLQNKEKQLLYILRMPTKGFKKIIAAFDQLYENVLLNKSSPKMVIDFRLPHNAFITL
ncbi:hypothetical protein PHSC3_001861 [Chlamydiales bacterium STE3]|nr:hypothetical protein PHSC3_001861 [Chlamydiales bacterium STE3]